MATAARVAPAQPEPEAQVQTQPQPSRKDPIEDYPWLCCKAAAEVPVPKFTVGDLLKLRKGTVVQTATRVADDIPVKVNQTLLGRGRFEVVNDRLVVRITELS